MGPKEEDIMKEVISDSQTFPEAPEEHISGKE